VLAATTILPHALVLRRSPEDLGMHPDGAPLTVSRSDVPRPPGMAVGEALRHTSFRWLAAAFWLATLCTIAIGVHLLPYLEDRGYDATFAASVTGLVGAMQVLARLLLAPFGNRANPRLLAAGILALQPLSLLVLLLVRSTPGVFLFVALFGAQRGLSTLARPALLADLYGRAQYASIAGVLQFTLSLAQAAAPVGAGAAYDRLGSYEPILWAFALISAMAVLAVLPARRAPGEALQSQP
jgi:predicted MFS family arabinose efflux permease